MEQSYDGKYDVKIVTRRNENGPTLCAGEATGKGFIEQEGLVFKDLAGDGVLYPYEDWRLSDQERAEDLANRLSVEQMLGLMLHTPQQMLPGFSNPYLGMATYDGKTFQETQGAVPPYALTDQQKEYVEQDFIRHYLQSVTPDAHASAAWVNQMQEAAEAAPFGVPVNISTDPRHGCVATDEFNSGAGGKISHWPENIGMAATFDVELERKYAGIVAREYRAMGFTTALSPQIDIATEPRWGRFSGSYGESSRLAADMARAYCDGLQTTAGGWGNESVIAMAKHWPGAGAVEAGREAHFPCGKYAVYPGGKFEDHMKAFLEGAFDLKEGTRLAAAVMPSYIIATGQDKENGEDVGIAYNKYLITTLLREKYGYDELVCTDWGLTGKMGPMDIMIGAKSWGVENLSPAEQSLKIIEAGCDQFGGETDVVQLKEAYALGVKRHGEAYMEARIRTSAVRILRNMFRLGLFENPYADANRANELVGTAAYCEAGFEAQVKSIVMLKNKKSGNGREKKAVLPLAEKTKVYVPKQYSPAAMNWMHKMDPEVDEVPVAKELLEKYFTFVDTPQEAEAAIVFMRMPKSARMGMDSGYSGVDKENGGNGYVPITRQYRPYTAEFAREESLAGGDPREDFANRCYKGKTATSYQEADLDALLDTKEAMGEKPVIACISSDGPMVVSEFERDADGILMGFGVTYEAFLQLICGRAEPYGLLPFQMPANMRTVEEQCEDVPFDMECHVDSEGNVYDFAYGMNWGGVIKDARVRKYKRQ